MRFADPQYLWALLLLPTLVAVGWLAYARRKQALQRFAGGSDYLDRFTDQVSWHRRAVKLLLLFVAMGSLILALARPQWGTRMEPVTREGSDVVVVLDTSLSMATEDLAPSRLVQAKHAIDTLLDEIEGDRVALVTFAGRANLTCPLTVDHAAVKLFLDSIDIDAVPVPGTALAQALRTAARTLRTEEAINDRRGRAVVLFTDGEDHEGGLDEVAAELAREAIEVYAVGCGTNDGAPIPIRDETGMVQGYKKDRSGTVVTSRIDEVILEDLALETGGRYFRATAGEVEIDQIASILRGLEGGEFGSQLRTRYEERFQIPLGLALVALFAETLLGDRRRAKRPIDSREKEAA